MSTNPTTEAQMRETRIGPLNYGNAPCNSGTRYAPNKRTNTAMIAANERNGISFDGSRSKPVCSLSRESDFDAAHILPHSYWSSARLHEWLFYAGVLPNGGLTSKVLQMTKVTERNIIWLRPEWARLMEPTRGGLVVVPEVSKLIEQAKAILNNIPPHPLSVFHDFSAPLLLKNWTESVQVTAVDSSNVYPYSIWLTNRDSLNRIPQALERLVFFQGQRSVHTVIQDTAAKIPLSYEPPLPTDWEWCLCPIITSLVAWRIMAEESDNLTMTAEAHNKKRELDEYLRLCESETPSSWKITEHQTTSLGASLNSNPDLRQRKFPQESWTPPLSTKPILDNSQTPHLNPPSTPSDQPRKRKQRTEQVDARTRQGLVNEGQKEKKPREETSRQPANGGKGTGDEDKAFTSAGTKQRVHDFFEEDGADTSLETKLTSRNSVDGLISMQRKTAQEEAMIVQKRYDGLRVRVQDNAPEGLVDRLEEEEDIMVQKASCLIRETFQKMEGEIGYSQAMRWLRSSERNTVDDEVDKIKLQWMKWALELEEEYSALSEQRSGDGSNVLEWQRRLCEASNGLDQLYLTSPQHDI